MKKQTRQRKPLPPEIIELMGKPPILSTEDEEVYYGIMERLSEDLATSDMIGWMLVQDLVDARIEIGRCRRFKAAIVEHGFRLRCRDLVENAKEAGNTAVKQLRAAADAELRKATTESFNDEKCLTKKKSEIEARFGRDCAEKRQIFDSLEDAWQK